MTCSKQRLIESSVACLFHEYRNTCLHINKTEPVTLSFCKYITSSISEAFAVADADTPILFVEIKCQLDATEVFIGDLIACSTFFGHHYAHHQELKSIIQWLLPVVFRAVVFKLLVWCAAEGYVSGLQDAAASCKPDT